jgi:TolB-like protein/DNA-binding winged helix-turn-helix (wHTH) protein/Tfp pilus assembly protein PilF
MVGGTLLLAIEAKVSAREYDHAGGRLRFGVFDLDLRAGELRKDGLRVRLQEQPFQVLAMLLERHGQVVTREELQRKLWPADTFVDFDHGLNKAISKIREALSDSAESPRFVETVARRGYRFRSDVRVFDPVPARGRELAARPHPPEEVRGGAERSYKLAILQHLLASRKWKAVVFAVLSLAASLTVWRAHTRSAPSPVIRSLAVLPLENLSSDASQDYFADGMTDELISDLGQISALRVISRTSVMGYKHARKPLPQIANELDVDAVVEGTVLRSGDQVRITAQLIEASTDKLLWSQSYESELRDTLVLQNQVARAIADQVQINLNPQEQATLKSAKLVNPPAFESYLKGRYFWNKRTGDALKTALAYFNEAIDEDPNYAQAYSGLADTYALLGDWQYAVMSTKETIPKAKAAAIKALQLDSSLSEAHTSLGYTLRAFDWDFDSAGKEFQRAIEINPSYATAHHWNAMNLGLLGRPKEALVEMRKAESLDPLSLIINADLAELLLLTHSYDESVRQSRKIIEMDPTFAFGHKQLGDAYLLKQMNKEAVEELQKAVRLSGGSPICTADLARAYVASGKTNEALKLLGDLKKNSNASLTNAPHIAMIYASMGYHDEAMHWLETAYKERFNPSILLRSGFGPLRSDPRFEDLELRIGIHH